MRRPHRRQRRAPGWRKLDPYSSEPRDALEWLSLLAGPRGMVDPGVGRSTRPGITPLDVAQALSMSGDRLGETLAMAIACQQPEHWRRIEDLAYLQFTALMDGSARGERMIAGARRFRARAVLRDAFQGLMAPARGVVMSAAAKALRMRVSDYAWLHKQASSWMEWRARQAAADMKRALFGPEDLPALAPPPVPTPKPPPAAATAAKKPVAPHDRPRRTIRPRPVVRRWKTLTL